MSRGRKALARVREERARHQMRNRFYRVGFAAVGFAVLLGGLALLVLPGPALVVIPIGLAMLALEFAWAERALAWAVERFEQGKERVRGARS